MSPRVTPLCCGSIAMDAGVLVAGASGRIVDRDAGEPRRLGGAIDEIAWWESACEVLDRGDTILPGHEWEILDAEPAGLVG
jgi:hypothetical protein